MIEKQGSKFVVLSNSGEILSTHKTRKEAREQEALLEIRGLLIKKLKDKGNKI